MQIPSSTIGLDLIAVKPMNDLPLTGKSKKQQLKEDRINKLRKLDGKEPNVVLPNDTYGGLVYLDYIYGANSGNTQKKYIGASTGIKNKKKK